MSTESLAVTGSTIWSRLPNEEQHAAQARGRLSPSARSSASTASSAASTSNRTAAQPSSAVAAAASGRHAQTSAPGHRTASPRSHQNGQPQYLHHQQQGPTASHFTSRDFAPSPRSSASTSGGSFPPTPDSSTSPHDRLTGFKVLPSGPPGSHTLGSTAGSTATPVAATSPAPSAQPLLAEVFSGNPRPHYRSSLSTSALASYQQYRPPAPAGSVSVEASPYPSYASPLASPPVYQEAPTTTTAPATRSYFASPPSGSIHGRARSASINPLERPSVAAHPTSETHQYAGMDAYSYGDRRAMNGSSGADQHGWTPSSDATGHSGGPISASLPTVSAVGSPTRGSALPHPTSGSAARGGGSYSPFGWNEDSAPLPTTAPGSGDREGRSRFRDLWGSAAGTTNGNGHGHGTGAGLSTSAGSTGGIGMSNMSPFSRDGSKLELDASWSGLSSLKSGGGAGGGGGQHGRLLREHSLGAVGTGRKRSDAALWGRPTLLREVEDEDGSEEEADVFHPPTKSGATSRRHSFAAFDPSNRGATTQIGFHLPPQAAHDGGGGGGGGGGFGPLHAPVSSSAWNNPHGGGGLGSSAINDDDLAADLNSLHLNLEVAAASNEPPRAAARHLHVGSMPANFPPARSSRALEHSRSPPPPHRDESTQAAPGSSPRATAEPFTPSIGSSVGSRFMLQGLQAPTPLPPATTPVVATASPTLGGPSSRFDGAPQQQQQQHYSQPPPQQQYQAQAGNRYGQYGQLPPPIPPPITTQHQYFTPATAAPSALSPRGPPARGGFPGYGNVPPPHLQQPGGGVPGMTPPPVPAPPQPPLSYFNPPPPPPPGMSQQQTSPLPLTAQAQTDMNLGRGVPLHAIPPGAPLCIVGFKAGRKDLFFCEDPNLHLEEGDLVIVEADRGRDVGKFLKSVTVDEVHKFQQHLVELALGQLASGGNPAAAGGMTGPPSTMAGMMPPGMGHDPSAGGGQGGTAQLARMTKECQPKRIFAKAGPADTHALLSKAQDEVKALALVRSKVAQKGLPMEILDAEWQWDRRKLTFYYTAETRVDFRELVRELFRIWKTRVWLCCLDQQQPSFDIQ
ncbi:hypothetical protein JCM3774_005856 [Rhodotorula dairenensis]